MSTSRTRERLQTALGARFRITRELGGGGMSETFVAHDATLEREIVIKVLAPALADSVNVERFSREIRLSATLQHPNLVPVLDSGVIDGLPYYTMPFIAGDSLRRRLDGTPLAVDAAIVILRDVARGLGAAHDRGVVHRDVKPDNVLLSGNAAIVTDLGIAKALATSGSPSSLTRTGIAMGTPAYFAPEQATGEEIDARADWYAFGVMAFEMLTGQLPFSAPTDAGMLVAHVTTAAPDIRVRRPSLPEPLASLIMQCLAKDPSARPLSADEVVRRLDAASSASDVTSTVSPARAASAARAGLAPGRDIRIAGVVLGVLMTAVIGVKLWRARNATTPPTAAGAVRTLWIADSRPTDPTERAELERIARTLRTRIPDAAGVALAERDTAFADSSAAMTFAKAHGAVIVQLAFRTVHDARGTQSSRLPSATIYVPAGDASCEIVTTRDSAVATELVERVLGTLAIRYDALLADRYLRGAGVLDRESMCTGYRLDALQRLAAFRADSTRPMARRIADLDTALMLDSGFIEARVDRATALGDTATKRALERGTEMNAANRLELEISRALSEQPLRALQLAERGAETGQVSLSTLARAALNVGHARTALSALDRARPSDFADAGGASMVSAMRAEAYFQLGDDARALAAAAPQPGADLALLAAVRLRSLAARGDSAAWLDAMREARHTPEFREREVLQCAAVALVAGQRRFSDFLYRMARDEGDVLLLRDNAPKALALLVAEAHRRTGDVSRALTLLDRLRSDRNPLLAMRAEQLRAVIALESANERVAREAVAAVEQLAARSPGVSASLALARIESVRGNVPRAIEYLQRAMGLGVARSYVSPDGEPVDFRAEADLVRVFATPAGKALMLASD